jgi:hypothetical protein
MAAAVSPDAGRDTKGLRSMAFIRKGGPDGQAGAGHHDSHFRNLSVIVDLLAVE